MSKQVQKKKPVLPTLREMPVGTSTDFPLARFNSVRSSCSIANMQYGIRCSTHIDRQANTITVTREE